MVARRAWSLSRIVALAAAVSACHSPETPSDSVPSDPGPGEAIEQVDVSPKFATLTPGGSLALAAVVTGLAPSVTWSVQGAASGTITAAGVYTAPAAAGVYTVVATSADDPSKSAAATVTVIASGGGGGNGAGVGACTALVSHSSPVPTSPLARPAHLASAIDPDFGTRITRVTGDWGTSIPNPSGDPSLVGATWRSVPAGPLYAKDPPWNADQTLLVVKKGVNGQLFVDGSTYQPLFVRTRGSQVFTDWRWHPTNPQYAIYVSGSGEVGWWDPRADAVIPKIAAPGGLTVCTVGGYEGSPSNDGRFLVVQCEQGGAPVFFVADVGLTPGAAGVKYPTIRASDLGFTGLDWATVSPLGNYVVASQGWTLIESAPLSPGMSAGDFRAGFSSGHLDLGLAADGATEVAYQAGGAEMFTLSTGAGTRLTSIGAGQYHSSTRNVRAGATGWGYGSLESTSGIMQGEIVAQELAAGGRIRRLAHHRTSLTSNGTEPTYEHMAFGAASPDGQRVFFRSDWGDGSGPVHGYVVDVRNLCP